MAISYTQKEGNVTVLGLETEFDGTLEFTDNLIITGKFNGKIVSDGSLVIEKTGDCKVDSISASSISIAGSVKGNMRASKKLEMFSGSKIAGNIETAKLRIADNVDFQGQVKMMESVPEVDVFMVSTAEYKKMVSERAETEDVE